MSVPDTLTVCQAQTEIDMPRTLTMLILTVISTFSAVAEAQQVHVNQLDCQGIVMGYPARVKGTRRLATHNALGDGKVAFQGTLTGAGMELQMAYGGYTRTAPFSGQVVMPQGPYAISVLDATGNNGEQMIIYDARPTMGPPTILGQLICQWK